MQKKVNILQWFYWFSFYPEVDAQIRLRKDQISQSCPYLLGPWLAQASLLMLQQVSAPDNW